jgi:hypothetical protein
MQTNQSLPLGFRLASEQPVRQNDELSLTVTIDGNPVLIHGFSASTEGTADDGNDP